MSKKLKPSHHEKVFIKNPSPPRHTLLNRLNKILNVFLIGSIFLLVIAEATFKIYDPDVMHYLASGREILTHGLSDTCIFTYTNVCLTVLPYEWLFHVMTYIIYTFGSWNGLVIFQVCIDVSIFILLFAHAKRSGSSIFSTALFLLFASQIAVERFQLRADLFGLLMFTLSYVLVSEYVQKRIYQKKSSLKLFYLFCIGITTVLWTNTHGSFPLSFVILGSFIGADIIKIAWNKFLNYDYSAQSDELKELIIVFAVTIGSAFVNPFGYKAIYGAFAFFFNVFNQPVFKQNMEWQSPFSPKDFEHLTIFFLKILIATTLILVLLRIKKIRLADVLLFFPILFIAASYIRNIALFSLVCALIFPYYTDGVGDFLQDRAGPKLKFLGKVLQNVITIMFIYFCFTMANWNWTNGINSSNPSSKRFGLGISELSFTPGAVQFIKQNHIHGNMFNDYSSGTYLNWTLYPEQKTFIDADTFSSDTLDYYNRVVGGITPYSEMVKKYKINYFFFRYMGYDSTPLISRLYADKDWKLVYFDETSAIFLANNQENKDIVNKYGIDFAIGRNFDKDHLTVVKETINLSEGFSNRGLFLSNLGLDNDALYQFTKAVAINKNNYTSHTNLGAAYYKIGDYTNAAKEYNLSIAIQPNFAPSHFNLGLIYQELQKNDDAIAQFQRALSINRGYKFANFSLGTLFESKKDIETAKEYYQQELIIDPNNNDARDALIRLEGGIVPSKSPIPNDLPPDIMTQNSTAKNGSGQDIIILEALVKKTPNNADLHFQLGVAYGAAGNLTKAIEELQTAIKIKPDLSIAHYNLGYAYGLQKQTDKALEEYLLAVKYDPSFPDTYLNLADIYLNKGLYGKAVEAYETYLKLSPKSPHAEEIRQKISTIQRTTKTLPQ